MSALRDALFIFSLVSFGSRIVKARSNDIDLPQEGTNPTPNIVGVVSTVNGQQRMRGTDGAGSGEYGASRDGGNRTHNGIDILATPDALVYAPYDSLIVSRSKPYSSGPLSNTLSGAKLRSSFGEFKIFYFAPFPNLIGKRVIAGEPIGTVQDVTLRYPNQGMQPHLHIELRLPDPAGGQFITDPTSFLNFGSVPFTIS